MSRMRRLLAAVAVLAIVLGGALIVISLVVIPGRDPNTIHDVGSLPDRISVCGRTWTRDTLLRQVTLAEATATKDGGAAVVVATGPGSPCPSGPCGSGAGTPCDTVVFVRVGQDAYVGYELSGGP